MHFPILEDYFQSLHFWQKTVIFHDKTALMLLLPINNKSRKISPHSQIHQTSHPNHKLPRANTTIFQNFFLNQQMLSAQLLLKKKKKKKKKRQCVLRLVGQIKSMTNGGVYVASTRQRVKAAIRVWCEVLVAAGRETQENKRKGNDSVAKTLFKPPTSC